MRVLYEFKPPKPSPAFIWLCESLLPSYLKFVAQLSINFVDRSGGSLDLLNGKPVVMVVNHSDRQDPLIVVALAKHMREPVYCPTARECFDWYNGVLGWFFQRFGCFSVNRDVVDIKSISTIQKLLTGEKNTLIVFPEAEVTGDDQSVHEVSPSLVHLFLKAQNERGHSEPIWILPVGVSYRLETDLKTSILPTLRQIERRLDIRSSARIDIEQRLERAVDKLLQDLSEQYRFIPAEEQPHHVQFRLLAEHICQRICNYIGLDPGFTEKLSTESLLHRLRNEIINQLANGKQQSAYQRKLSMNNSNLQKIWFADLDRVERLLIFRRVLDQPPSEIQFCRIVDFLENEICGRMTAKGKQTACVVLGKPLELSNYLDSYKSNKTQTIELLTSTIRDELQTALDDSHSVSDRSDQTTNKGSASEKSDNKVLTAASSGK
jgi:1-acyl-sn-glycerol-3-phosphate acyltransferase